MLPIGSLGGAAPPQPAQTPEAGAGCCLPFLRRAGKPAPIPAAAKAGPAATSPTPSPTPLQTTPAIAGAAPSPTQGAHTWPQVSDGQVNRMRLDCLRLLSRLGQNGHRTEAARCQSGALVAGTWARTCRRVSATLLAFKLKNERLYPELIAIGRQLDAFATVLEACQHLAENAAPPASRASAPAAGPRLSDIKLNCLRLFAGAGRLAPAMGPGTDVRKGQDFLLLVIAKLRLAEELLSHYADPAATRYLRAMGDVLPQPAACRALARECPTIVRVLEGWFFLPVSVRFAPASGAAPRVPSVTPDRGSRAAPPPGPAPAPDRG